MPDDLSCLDATAQAALVADGTLSPGELVAAAIERIERVDPVLNAVIHERFAAALAEADTAPAGPLRGVPILVKDLDGSLAGEPLHRGNRALRDAGHRGDRDSYLFAKLRAAGAVVVGKTNTPELGLLPTTEPLAYGATRNPWDLGRSAGGSSGGSGAAVASGMVALAHAGDGGGSIRIPASACALFGLKPTRGRVSLGPGEGEAWGGMVVRHVLVRSVRDCALALDVLAGAMPGDPSIAPPPARPFLAEVGAPPGRLRIGVRADTTPAGVADVDPACRAAVRETAELLARLGHEVVDASPAALDETVLLDSFITVFAAVVTTEVDGIAAILGRDVGAGDVEPATWAQHELGRTVPATAYIEAVATAQAWARRIAAWWADDGFDLLLTPTMARPPAPLGEISGDDADGAFLAATPYVAFTLPFNVTGQPAVSVPLAWHDGVPIGVQLVGAFGREDVLLRVGAQLEAARPWTARVPPVHASRR